MRTYELNRSKSTMLTLIGKQNLMYVVQSCMNLTGHTMYLHNAKYVHTSTTKLSIMLITFLPT